MLATRRDFMRSLGIGIASLVLTRCTSQQDPSTVGEEQSFSNLPSDTPTTELDAASKTASSPSQKPTTITTEPQIAENSPGQIQGHPMTPSEVLEYFPFNDPNLPAFTRLRQCWENLHLLERHQYDPNWTGGDPRSMLIKSHINALDELVVMGELSQEGAQELHGAFIAAINHVLTNSIPMTCYD
jgi:hypothetical protein